MMSETLCNKTIFTIPSFHKFNVFHIVYVLYTGSEVQEWPPTHLRKGEGEQVINRDRISLAIFTPTVNLRYELRAPRPRYNLITLVKLIFRRKQVSIFLSLGHEILVYVSFIHDSAAVSLKNVRFDHDVSYSSLKPSNLTQIFQTMGLTGCIQDIDFSLFLCQPKQKYEYIITHYIIQLAFPTQNIYIKLYSVVIQFSISMYI